MNLEALDQWTPPRRFTVEPGAAASFAAATNDPDPHRLSGTGVAPMYAVVPARAPAIAATEAVVPAEIRDSVPGLHGEQDMRFPVPLRPGMELSVTAAARGVQVKPSGTLVAVEVRLTGADGVLAGEHWVTSFFPGVSDGASAGVMPPGHTLPAATRAREPDARIELATDPDQTFRYAAAARDPTRFHVDEAEAHRLGLPGLILHGLCTMAICAHALAGERELRRLAVRFARPVRPGGTLRLSIWNLTGDGRRAFEAAAEGEIVIRNGLIELARRGSAGP